MPLRIASAVELGRGDLGEAVDAGEEISRASGGQDAEPERSVSSSANASLRRRTSRCSSSASRCVAIGGREERDRIETAAGAHQLVGLEQCRLRAVGRTPAASK